MPCSSPAAAAWLSYYICQWLANYYLEELDHYIMTLPGVKYMDRYMDNITLRGPNKKQLHKPGS